METSMKVIGFTSYLSDFIIKVYFFFNYLILQAYLYVPENLLLSSYKILIFVIGAGMASVAGVMYAYYISFIAPTSFTIMESIFIISIVIIGGAGNIWGSVLAAAVLVILPEALRFLGMPSAIAANMRQIIYGALLVIFMLFRPQGFIGEYSFRK